MRRHGDLWPMITDIGNLRLAFQKAAQHKTTLFDKNITLVG